MSRFPRSFLAIAASICGAVGFLLLGKVGQSIPIASSSGAPVQETPGPGPYGAMLEAVGGSDAARGDVEMAESAGALGHLAMSHSVAGEGAAAALASIAHHLTFASASLESAQDGSSYLESLIWREKLIASAGKISAGDYEVVADISRSSKRETIDVAYSAFPVGGSHYRVEFHRAKDPGVFAALDAMASLQQEAWDQAARDFNALPTATRQGRFARDRELQEELDRISRSLTRILKAGAKGPAELDSLSQQGRMVQGQREADGIPFYLVRIQGSDTVRARRSIGR
jgi:hypothetical protein